MYVCMRKISAIIAWEKNSLNYPKKETIQRKIAGIDRLIISLSLFHYDFDWIGLQS